MSKALFKAFLLPAMLTLTTAPVFAQEFIYRDPLVSSGAVFAFDSEPGNEPEEEVPAAECLETLLLGESCSDGVREVVYAGDLDGRRLYTTVEDQSTGLGGEIPWTGLSSDGFYLWSTENNTTGATSTTNGLQNTYRIMAMNGNNGITYPAAETCHGLGREWYLPALQELDVLLGNMAIVGGFNPSYQYMDYWTSTEVTRENARYIQSGNMSSPVMTEKSTQGKVNGTIYGYRVRCLRGDQPISSPGPNTSTTFTAGGSYAADVGYDQSFSLAQALEITDPDFAQNLSWTVLTPPTHGTLFGFPATRKSHGGVVRPFNVSYSSPSSGSADSFTIQVSDGHGSASIEVAITLGDFCDYNNLALGEICSNEPVAYVGQFGGDRIYMSSTDLGSMVFGSGPRESSVIAASFTDGMSNTDSLVNASTMHFNAAQTCRAIGSDWYLPAADEYDALFDNLPDTSGSYWTSTQTGTAPMAMGIGSNGQFNAAGGQYKIRCAWKG